MQLDEDKPFNFFRYMFWTEFGNITEIGRTSMDGTSKSYIATTQIGWPNGLTIDFTCKYHITITYSVKFLIFLQALTHNLHLLCIYS